MNQTLTNNKSIMHNYETHFSVSACKIRYKNVNKVLSLKWLIKQLKIKYLQNC